MMRTMAHQIINIAKISGSMSYRKHILHLFGSGYTLSIPSFKRNWCNKIKYYI